MRDPIPPCPIELRDASAPRAGRWPLRALSAALALVAILVPGWSWAHPSGLPQLRERANFLVATTSDWLFWDFHPSILIGIATLTTLYTLAIRRWRRDDELVDARRARWFYASMVLAWFVLDGPLHHLADELLFAAHMVQHLALQLVWAPMFLFGIQPWMVTRFLKRVPVTGAARWITRPTQAFLIYNGTIWLWHLPIFYNMALLSHEWHIVEHLLFMSTAVVFWWPLLSSAPEIPRPAFGSQMMFVFSNMIAMKALGMIISLQDDVIYTFYINQPRVWGLTPIADQQVGGMLMWLPGGFLLWGGLGYVFAQWARRGTPKRGTSGIASVDRLRAARAAAAKPTPAVDVA